MTKDRERGAPAPADPPITIGPYRLVRVLGEGGMGVVWLTEQTEPIQRQVALKIIRLGTDTQEVVSRFETERQALAVMEHPNIARVFDAGTTEEGLPFFVMELVPGLPLTDYCDTNHLSIENRIRLFQDVCRAVQHAHQKGIIHRDLKPSNVLITETDGRPHPKIIDFGIARATEEVGSEDSRLTRQHHQIGTPAYMSPEQILGENQDIDTRSDIYALGVLLYELLTGVLPFPRKAYRGAGLLAQLSQDPPTPSSRLRTLSDPDSDGMGRQVDIGALRRSLSGDLDWIVLKAMAKERNQRYETVNALTMELGRYLSNEPVLARPPSAVYRAKKFVRRHRTATLVAGLALLAGIGFVVSQSIQSQRIRQARDLAQARRVQAEGLIDFMLGDLRQKLEPIGRLDILGDVGDQALAYFATLPESEYSDEELLTRSKALYQIGEVRLNQGDHAAAVGPLQESHRLAEALWDREPDNTDRLFGLAQSHFWVGYAHWLVGDLEAAEAEFLGYLDAAEALIALDPESPEFRMELAYAHGNLGSLMEARGDLQGAIAEYQATIPIEEELVRGNPDNLDWQLELAEGFNKIGVGHRKLGAYREAEEAHRQELELKEDLIRREPGDAYYRRRLSTALDFLGDVQMLRGNLAEAEAKTRRSVAIIAELATADPSNVELTRSEAVGRRQLARILLRLGSVEDAEENHRSARQGLAALGERGITTMDWRGSLARTVAGLARVELEKGAVLDALEAVSEARALLEAPAEVAAERDRAGAEVELVAGRVLQALGRTDQAREAWEKALVQLEDHVARPGGGDHRILELEALILLGRVQEAQESLTNLQANGFGEPWILAEAEAAGLSP